MISANHCHTIHRDPAARCPGAAPLTMCLLGGSCYSHIPWQPRAPRSTRPAMSANTGAFYTTDTEKKANHYLGD